MKETEYIEGSKAQDNFEEGMKALFNVPKEKVVLAEEKAKKRKKASRVRSQRKPKTADKD